MRRRILKTLIALGGFALILFIAACNPNPSAEDIKLSDIGDHKGSTDYGDAETADGDFKTASGDMGSGIDEVEGRNVTLADMRGRFLDGLTAAVEAKVMSKDVTVTGSTSPDDLSGNYRVVVTEETVNGTDVTPIGSGGGTMYIPSYTNEVSYSIASDGSSMTGDLWAQGSIVYTDFDTDANNVVIDDGKVNLGVNGTATFSYDQDTGDYTLSYSLYFALKAGFALHNKDTGEGGRVLLNMEFSESLEPTVIYNDVDELLSSTTFPVETTFTATMEIYDNDGEPIDNKPYDEDDVMLLFQNASLM